MGGTKKPKPSNAAARRESAEVAAAAAAAAAAAPKSQKKTPEKSPIRHNWTDQFKMFDKNNDGKISVKEMGTVLRSMGFRPNTAELNDILSSLDADGNGFLEYAEFASLMDYQCQKHAGESEEEKILKAAFKTFDRDGNGLIDKNELKQALVMMGEKPTEEMVQSLMRTADKNKDGSIDYEEFKAAMANTILDGNLFT